MTRLPYKVSARTAEEISDELIDVGIWLRQATLHVRRLEERHARLEAELDSLESDAVGEDQP